MHEKPVEIRGLWHAYGERELYRGLSLEFEKGKMYGLLGKNGVGKTTLIRILMGFLRPLGGECRLFGEPAHAISPSTRARVGLLFERHLAYDFFSIEQVERFMSGFYPGWKRERYYTLVDLLGLDPRHRIAHMSEGQRSQVVLGLVLAQDPELLVLDDYSMGLDAGYRRLFTDCLREYLGDGKHTVILTSHVIQDMDRFVDEVVFLRQGGDARMTPLGDFMEQFHCHVVQTAALSEAARRALGEMGEGRCRLPAGLVNVEAHGEHFELFGFLERDALSAALVQAGQDVPAGVLELRPMSLEDAFVGYTGRR